MREEIIAGLKNAMERGESLAEAMQSLINAGYNSEEVKAAGGMFSTGASQIIQPQNIDYRVSQMQAQQQNPQQKFQPILQPTMAKNLQNMQREPLRPPPLPRVIQPRYKKNNTGKRIIIIAIVLSSLIFLGSLGYLIYALIS